MAVSPGPVRIISFDMLRGLAALGVAIPHIILLFGHNVAWESVSIIAVEIFFALSGYVLAPQIIKLHKYASNYNLWVFFLRRWIRTITPYVIAVALIALLTSNLFTSQFLTKVLFLDTLVNVPETDFFAISWSLAVEEWYYVTAAVLVFAFRKSKLSSIFLAAVTVLFAVKVLGIVIDDNWSVAVRRATIYRLDAIAFGFLMFLWQDRLPQSLIVASFATLASIGLTLLSLWGFKSDTAGMGELFMLLAIYSLSAFSLSVVYLTKLLNRHFSSAIAKRMSWFFGAISYPVYLFHLPIAYAVHKLGYGLPVTLVFATAMIVLFSWLFHTQIERHFIDNRPSYVTSPEPKAELDQITPFFRAGMGVAISAAALLAVSEIASQRHLDSIRPTLAYSLFYEGGDLRNRETKSLFEAIDPILGYAHPKKLGYKTKEFGVSIVEGFGVHRPKQGDHLKVYVLGGSTSDPYIAVKNDERPWTYYLYTECRGVANCGVWNGAVGGFGSHQELIKLIRDVLPERPDIVVSLHGPNELNRIITSPFTTGYQLTQATKQSEDSQLWLSGWFPNIVGLLSMVRNSNERPFAKRDIYMGHHNNLSPFESWKQNTSMMHAVSAVWGARYFTVLQPIVGSGKYSLEKSVFGYTSRNDIYYQNVAEFYSLARAHCSTVDYCFDLSQIFNSSIEMLYRDVRHPNEAGNKLIARQVAVELQKRGAFPK